MFKDDKTFIADGRVVYAVLSDSQEERLLTVVKNGVASVVKSATLRPSVVVKSLDDVNSVATRNGVYTQKQEIMYEQN